ncbi:kinase-like domain-containing protein [Dichotomocladium elegans]|nr:kinase-like domain-containing protein [Dichotomocladium elegans]
MLFKTTQRHIDMSLEWVDRSYLDRLSYADLVDFCQDLNISVDGDKPRLIDNILRRKECTAPVPAPAAACLSDEDDYLYKSHFEQQQLLEQQRLELISRGFSVLFLGDSPGMAIPYYELNIRRRLGSGGFKDCYEGVYKGEPVAIGELRLAQFNEMDLADIKHEIQVLKQLRHENVIRFIGVCTDPQHLCIITELCEKGDLFEVIRGYKKPSFSQQITYMYDIALGVSYLHQRRPSIIHRDLKSMNILITRDDRAKVNDFGLARIRPKANALMHTQCAPEFWSENPSYTEKVDVYACGLIFWEILTWNEFGYPYQGLSEHALYARVRNENCRPPLIKLTEYCPRDLLLLITHMWDGDPEVRPSMTQVVENLSKYF